eukprot:11085516-Alexandrium_andersonii.AAC.1
MFPRVCAVGGAGAPRRLTSFQGPRNQIYTGMPAFVYYGLPENIEVYFLFGAVSGQVGGSAAEEGLVVHDHIRGGRLVDRFRRSGVCTDLRQWWR